MRILILIAAMTLGACAGEPPVNRSSSTPLSVASIETEPYLGHWFEQARLPNSFERDCVAATADYALRDDGLISVRNVCTKEDGGQSDVSGRARLVGVPGEGKLEVSFFGPFWGDYWVLERAPDYSWSIVGEPEGRYLWILTRSETISAEQRADFARRLQSLGYQTDALYWRPVSG
ncbi:MAG: lipocalin family protein [Terricaulis sp.]